MYKFLIFTSIHNQSPLLTIVNKEKNGKTNFKQKNALSGLEFLFLASWRDWGEFGKGGGVFPESLSKLQSNPVLTGVHGIVINEQGLWLPII